MWSLFDSPIAAVGTLVFSFFGAALRQFSSVSFSIREAVSETGDDGFFLNLTYFLNSEVYSDGIQSTMLTVYVRFLSRDH